MWVGLGSNLLVRDGGIRGVVICTHGAFTRLERRAQLRVYCEAGVPCARVTRQCANWGLGHARVLRRHSRHDGRRAGDERRRLRRRDLGAGAPRRGDGARRHLPHARRRANTRSATAMCRRRRTTSGSSPRNWSSRRAMRRRPHVVRELAQRRKLTQPLGEWSCGSVFTNPPGDHAARLIEAAGLKGFRIGGAVVSEKHANFILNEGEAHGARPRGADRARARDRAARARHRPRARSAHRRGERLMRLRHDSRGSAPRERMPPISAASRCCWAAASAEREISLLSGKAVLAALKRRGVDAHGFDPADARAQRTAP